MLYLLKKYTSDKMVWVDDEGQKHYPGDLLGPHRDHIKNRMFNGFDFDQTMLRIAAMNLMLHDIESPCINNQDTLSNSFVERYPTEAEDYFDVILANPPFKGSIDSDNVHASLRSKVKTTKTELLFLALIVRMLKILGLNGAFEREVAERDQLFAGLGRQSARRKSFPGTGEPLGS